MWGWVVAAIVTALWLDARNEAGNLKRALALADQRMAQLQTEIAQLRLQGHEDQQRIAALRQTVVEREMLLRQLQATAAQLVAD